MVSVLVTGGAGFIGSHLVDRLVNKGYDICVFDNLHRGNLQNIKKSIDKVKFVTGDIRNFKKINNAIKGYDIVFHLAAQSNVIGSIKNPEYTFSTNVDGTLNTLKAAQKNKVKRFIFMSSREVYGDPEFLPVDNKHPLNPKNLYGKTKLGSEILCNYFHKFFNLRTVILRVSNVYGPRDKERVIPVFMENLKHNKDLTVYGGRQILDFIWIDDVIDFLVRVMEDGSFTGKTINLGSGKGTKIMDLARMVISLSKSKSKIIRKKKRHYDVDCFVADIKNLDIKPTKLEDGLKKLISINKL